MSTILFPVGEIVHTTVMYFHTYIRKSTESIGPLYIPIIQLQFNVRIKNCLYPLHYCIFFCITKKNKLMGWFLVRTFYCSPINTVNKAIEISFSTVTGYLCFTDTHIKYPYNGVYPTASQNLGFV